MVVGAGSLQRVTFTEERKCYLKSHMGWGFFPSHGGSITCPLGHLEDTGKQTEESASHYPPRHNQTLVGFQKVCGVLLASFLCMDVRRGRTYSGLMRFGKDSGRAQGQAPSRRTVGVR